MGNCTNISKVMAKQVNNNIYLDLEAIMDFVFTDDGIRSSDVEITDNQVRNEETGVLETETRTVREIKSSDTNKQTLRYDMLKTFIEMLDAVEVDGDVAPLTLGQHMVLNTMGTYGLIKEMQK